MKYLADTNIFLEVILEQKNYASARAFLAETPGESLCVSDYSLHSIGLFLFKRGKHHEFEQMLEDLLGRLMVNVLSLQGLELTQVGKFAGKFNMDFDDAYQYAIADKYGLTIVSFDSDFDRTEKGRKLPENVVLHGKGI